MPVRNAGRGYHIEDKRHIDDNPHAFEMDYCAETSCCAKGLPYTLRFSSARVPRIVLQIHLKTVS